LAAVTGHSYAQDLVVPARLTLGEALRLATERNPTLAAARNTVEIARAQRLDSRVRPNPAFTFESVGRPPGTTPPSLDDHEYLVRVDQELETAGRRRLRMQVAETGLSAAEAAFRDEQRRLEFDVCRTYFSVVLAKADVEVARAALEEIDRVIELNRARYHQGEISGGEVRRLQVERLRFVDDLFAADLALRNARSTLLALLDAPDLGLEFDVVETLSPAESSRTVPQARPRPAPLDRALLRTRALTARPDLLAAERDIERSDTETRLQRALRTPNITLGGGYSHLGGLNTVAFGVTVPIPLFNRNPGGIARAEAERRQAANRAAAVRVGVLLDVQQAIDAVEVSRARVEYIEREYLIPARESRDIVLASYRLGSADLIDFLDAQRAFRDTLRTYNRALYEQRVSLFQLAAATGGSAQPSQVTQ
jgi:cobalt-zinc-cadmium efflux system outer membrane protein